MSCILVPVNQVNQDRDEGWLRQHNRQFRIYPKNGGTEMKNLRLRRIVVIRKQEKIREKKFLEKGKSCNVFPGETVIIGRRSFIVRE